MLNITLFFVLLITNHALVPKKALAQVIDEKSSGATSDVGRSVQGEADQQRESRSTEGGDDQLKGQESDQKLSSKPDSLIGTSQEKTQKPQRIFGRYRVRMSILRPQFTDQLKFYSELYGKEKLYPQIQADWFAWDWYATFGLSFRGGFYSAQGHAAKSSKSRNQITSADFTGGDSALASIDKAGPTTLTMIPLQTALTAQFTPFQRKWVVIDGYVGYEYLYWQEVRSQVETQTVGRSQANTTRNGDRAFLRPMSFFSQSNTLQAQTKGDSYTNKGVKKAIVSGVSLNILLNALDLQSVASMNSSMGLGSIYVSPFMEIVRQIDSGVSFSRKVYGLGFTFESLR